MKDQNEKKGKELELLRKLVRRIREILLIQELLTLQKINHFESQAWFKRRY